MRKTVAFILTAALLLPALVIAPFFAVRAHAATVYAICTICDGSGKCGLCDPKNTPEGTGDGWLHCGFCDANGMRKCGTNHTGDGTPIGCDGSGYLPDGSVCWNCDGTGKYPCDACHGEKKFKCKCNEMGQPGKCTVCYGTGWYTVDSQGQKIEIGHGVYPPDGAKLDAGAWGRHEYYTYNASRFGTGVTPYQAMAKYGASTRTDFYKVLGGGTVGGSGGNGGGGNSGGNSGNGGAGDNGGNAGSDNQDDRGGDPDENPPENSGLEVAIPPDAQLVNDAAKQEIDEMFIFSRRVDGTYLMTVRFMKSWLSPDELEALHNMTEADFAAMREKLETAANGFRYLRKSVEPAEKYRVDFEFGDGAELPFPCEMLLQLPAGSVPADARLYRVKNGGFDYAGDTRLEHDEDGDYLTFTDTSLGDYIYAVGNPDEIFSDAPSSDAEPPQGSEPVESKPNNVLPIILIALGVLAAASAVVIPVAIKKRKGK